MQISNAEMITISRAEYEEKNARPASQDERISRLGNQIEVSEQISERWQIRALYQPYRKKHKTLWHCDQKNFLFANTPKGATSSAVMFSLIQTAIENSLDPYQYLCCLFRASMKLDLTRQENVQTLLP